MFTFGWVSRYSCIFVFSLFTTTIINAQSNAVVEINADKEITTSLSTVFETSNAFVTSFTNLNYYTAHNLMLAIPGTEYELVVNWGFGGSGDTLSPLPSATVTIQATNQTKTTTTPFSVVELSKLLIKEELKQHTKHISFLRWLSESTLNPAKLFCLKLLILISNYQQTLIDGSQLRSEIFRLMIRLGLVENIGLQTKKFSTYLPEILADLIKDNAPETINFIDTAWTALTEQSSSLEIPLTVYACPLTGSDTVADRYFKIVQQGTVDDFINGLDIITFNNVSTNHKPDNMPETLKKEALGNINKFIKVKADSGETWVGYVTDKLGLFDTARLVLATTIKAVKEYVAVRKDYFKNNPLIAQQYVDQLNELYKNQRRIQAFLQTAAGKASVQRLTEQTQQIDADIEIKQPEQKTKQANKSVELTNTIQILKQELESLKADEKTLVDNITKNTVSKNKSYTGPSAAAFQKIVEAYEKNLKSLQAKIAYTEDQINKLYAKSSGSTTTSIVNRQPINDAGVQLKKLQDFASMLKQNGETIPTTISARITELESTIKTPSVVAVDETNTLFETRISMREQLAKAYETEANILVTECKKIKDSLNKITTQTEKEIADYTFLIIEQPQYTAYIQHLSDKATTIRAQNQMALELNAYRTTFAQTKSSDIPTDLKKEISMLESSVGWLCNNQKSEGFLAEIINTTPEIKQFVQDLQSDIPEYAKIKNTLLNDICNILKRVNNIKEHINTYRYMVASFTPRFLPTFDQLVNASTVLVV